MTPRRQFGLLWGGVALAMILLSPLAGFLAHMLPPCPFKTLTGYPCATCGVTRAALGLAHFEILNSLLRYPLATIGWVVLIGGGLLAGAAALLGRELPEPPARLSVPVRIAIVAVILLNWVYLILTGV